MEILMLKKLLHIIGISIYNYGTITTVITETEQKTFSKRDAILITLPLIFLDIMSVIILLL